MLIKTHLTSEQTYKRGDLVLTETISLDNRGKAVAEFISRWGMIAGVPDGEDSAGRAKIRLATTEELVKRAFDVVELMFNEAKVRGMTLEITQEDIDRTYGIKEKSE